MFNDGSCPFCYRLLWVTVSGTLTLMRYLSHQKYIETRLRCLLVPLFLSCYKLLLLPCMLFETLPLGLFKGNKTLGPCSFIPKLLQISCNCIETSQSCNLNPIIAILLQLMKCFSLSPVVLSAGGVHFRVVIIYQVILI